MSRRNSHFRPASSALALEPRLLFDGAGAVAAVDGFDAGQDHQAEAQKQETKPAAEARPSDAMESAPGATLLIIDARVADHQSLLTNLPANVTVRVIDTNESGLGAISEELAKGGEFDAIHILSHGTPGNFSLGTDQIGNNTLAAQSAVLQAWAGHLSADADILLYGCDIAQGEAGQAFISELAHLTGADIAASTNATGSAEKGGDWVLERSTGSIEAGVLVFSGYGEVLAAPTVTDTAPADEPFSVGENTPKVVGSNITVTGTGADSLTVTASVTKGTLSASTVTGDAAAVETWLASLSYTYTGTSQTGDSDTLTLSIVNNTNVGTTVFNRSIAIAPENDAPVMTPPASGAGRLSVAEGGNAAFAAGAGTGTAGSPVTQINLGLSDLDNTQNQIIIKLTGLPGQGTLKLNGNELTIGSTFAVSDIANLHYHHNGNQVLSTTTDTFQITVDDGAGGLLTLQTVTVDITPVNQAPSVGGGIVLIEGETGVKLVGENIPVIGGSRGNLTIADPDDTAGTHAVQITGLPAHGVLKYNGVAVSDGQTIANANLSLFTYDHDGSETTSDSFTIKVTDAGGGEGAGAAITTTDQTVNLTIIPNNDDPVWNTDPGKGAVTVPDATNSFGPVIFGPDAVVSAPSNTHTLPITTAMLHVVDAESGPERLTYTLTSTPSGGYLTHSGYSGQYLPVGFTFTQAEIDAGKISFVNTTGNSHSTDFKFTVMDGDRRLFESGRDGGIYADEAAATPLTVHTFKIEYKGTATGTGPGGSPPTAAPIPTIDNNLGLTDAQIAESQYFTLNDTYLKASSTGSTPEQITYRLLTLPSNGSIVLNGTALGLLGSFTQADINASNVKFQHDDSEDFTASFTFDVSNGSQITAAQTFHIDVKPQNDMPVARQGDTVKLTEGSTIVLNAGGKTHITLADKDNDPSDKSDGYATDNVLSFRVTAPPEHGSLWFKSTEYKQGSFSEFVVTKAELDNGDLEYRHDGSENYTDSFTIVPLDSANVGATSNNTDANTNPPAGNPTNQASEGTPKVIDISVNPLNDAPIYVAKAEPGYDGKPALKEGTEFTIWGATYSGGTYGTGSGTATPASGKDHYLVYQDSDNTSEQRQYRITTATQYGVLTAGGRVLGVGSVFTQAELDSGAVKYKHGGGEQFDDRFFYVVSDGDYGANASTSDNDTAFVQGAAITPSEYRIRLERSNDKPTISTSHTGLFVVDSSAPANAKTLPAITLGDKDIADGIQAGETDFVQITVQFLESDGATPYTNGVLQFESGYDPASQGTGVAVTDAAGDNTLVFTGKLADVQAALAKVQARTNGADADASNLKIKVTIDDRLGGGGANGGTINDDGSAPNNTFNTASITINVAASDKNDPPTVTLAAGPIVVNEDVRTLINTAITAYTDPDAFDSTANSITLTVTKGTLYFHSSNTTVTGGAGATGVGTGSVTLTGTKLQLDTALDNLRYLSNTDYNGDDVLTVTVTDGGKNGLDGDDNSGGGSNTGTVNIAILPVNDAPTVTLPGANGYHAITGGSYEFSTANGNAISIADAKDFTGSDGVDGQQHGLDTNFTVTLNAKLGGADYGTITITTPGAVVTSNGTHTVSLTGSRADINAALASGVTFTPAAGNLDGTVEFIVTVNDNNNGGTALTDPVTNTAGITGPQTASQKLYLQPTDVNAAPVFSGLDNAPTFIQNGSAIVLDPNALLSDPELDLFGASGNWNGAILTLQRDGGANANDVFGFTGSGSTGVNVSGGNLRIGTDVVGTFTNTGGTLTITFNTAATAARVDTVLQAITYRNTDANPDAAVIINYTIDDQNPNVGGSGTAGTGQDQGTGGKLIGTGSITIGINRQVIAEPDSNSINEASSAGDPTTVTGDITPGATNSNDHGGTQDRDPDTGQTITVQGVVAGGTENAKGTGINGIASANVGTTVTGTYGSIVINANGTYTYTLDNSNATVNALKPGETLKDSFSYAINDGAGPTQTTAWSVLTITINGQNDPPVATDNVNSVTENTGTPATGNVRSNGTPDSDPDTPFVDLKLTQIVGNTTETITDGSTSASGGSVVQGKYGTLTIGADGSYSYALDDSNPAVNALNNGQTLTDEVFTYTLSDGSKTDTATLTITINGRTDGAPNIVANDGNGAGATGQATVFEKGLTSVGDTTETTAGTITVQAPDGIASVTIGGTTFTLAELDVLSAGSPSGVIDTGEGELRITGISNKVGPASAPTSAEVSYTYTLKARQDHGAAPGTEVSDSIAISVSDKNSTPQTANGTLTVQIIDDVPTALADTGNVKATETLTVAAADGVLKNDTSGADAWGVGGAVVGVVTGSYVGTPSSGNVAAEITGAYGKLTLNADGSYTYIANAAAPGAAPTTTDVFTYTVRDADGDETTSTLTITIQNNRPPVAVDDARTTPEDTPVSGNVIGSGGTGDVADSDPDSDPLTVTQIVINGATTLVPADGSTVTVNIPGSGTLVIDKTGSYSFTPVPDWNGTVPPITYTVSDGKGASNSTATAILQITVTPVVDVANDSVTTLAGRAVTSKVLENDSFEGSPVVTATTPPANGTVMVNPDGSITYTPDPGFSGSDSYTYTVTCGGVTETAKVVVSVTPENSPLPAVPFEGIPPVPPITDLQPLNPFDRSPVMVDAGPYFGSERFDDVRRMPLPFHPIVYVTREVQFAQQQRSLDDRRHLSQPGSAQHGDINLLSLGVGLKADPTLFVQHAVRDSHRQASFLSNTVDGRLGRVSLSSDHTLPSPHLFETRLAMLLDKRLKTNKGGVILDEPLPTEVAMQPEQEQEQETEALAGEDGADFLSAGPELSTDTAPAAQPLSAPSFNDQLRHSANRLPLAGG